MNKKIVFFLGIMILSGAFKTVSANQVINNNIGLNTKSKTTDLSVYQTERVKLSDGVYLVHYGNVQIIEDDNKQMSIRIEVKDSGKKDSRTGEVIYDLFCNNKFVKSVNIWLLSEAISTALKATVWGAAVPSGVVKIAVGAIYESICEYYR